MSGHNKWSQIKRQKEKTDGKKSQVFSKFAKLITDEAKKAGGNRDASGLKSAVERAKAANMPTDNIERAIKKASGEGVGAMESIVYESYGPGGCAMMIEALTTNRNKAAQEVKHILSKNGFQIATPGSASWAFTRENMEWVPNMTVDLSDEDLTILGKLTDDLEDNDEVQSVYTNVE